MPFTTTSMCDPTKTKGKPCDLQPPAESECLCQKDATGLRLDIVCPVHDSSEPASNASRQPVVSAGGSVQIFDLDISTIRRIALYESRAVELMLLQQKALRLALDGLKKIADDKKYIPDSNFPSYLMWNGEERTVFEFASDTLSQIQLLTPKAHDA